MRYEITRDDNDVEIRLQQTGEQAPQLLAALADCQQGRCGCPTDEYERLEDMTIKTGVDDVTIRLHARDGQRLDTGQLRACLDYTVTEAQRDID